MNWKEKYLNKVVQGDCLDVMAELPDKCIDLVLTSPPYDGLRKYNGFSFDFPSIAPELFRITKDGGVVVWVVGDASIEGSETGTSFKQALLFKDVGFKLHDTMIYEKPSVAFFTPGRYLQSFEYMFVFSKGKPKTAKLIKDRINKSCGEKVKGTQREADGSTKKKSQCGKIIERHGIRKNIWKINHDRACPEHPATFPAALAGGHIETWSVPGGVVFDPFMGSGTTAVVAKQMGRMFLGAEISSDYVDICNKRLAQETLF